jgi:hypothetical protein
MLRDEAQQHSRQYLSESHCPSEDSEAVEEASKPLRSDGTQQVGDIVSGLRHRAVESRGCSEDHGGCYSFAEAVVGHRHCAGRAARQVIRKPCMCANGKSHDRVS